MADFAIRPSTQISLAALAQAQKTLAISAERISSGLRILSPTDGPAAFFDASELSARALRLLEIKENITNAATVTGATVSALNSIINTVNQLKAKALTTQAQNISTTVIGDIVTSSSADITDTIANVNNNDSFDITYSGATTTIINNNGETFATLAAQITAISGLTATVSDGNPLTITAEDGNDIVITDNARNLGTDLGLSTSTNGTNASSSFIESAETEYDVLRLQLNTLAGLASTNGTNFISINPDTLKVSFDEDGTSSITVVGVASDANGLGITAIDSANGFSTQVGITAAIAELDAALTTLQATKASFTSYDVVFETRLTFTDSLIELLDEGAIKLTGVDLSAEEALSLATQTRHDLTLSGINLLLSDSALFNLLNVGLTAP